MLYLATDYTRHNSAGLWWQDHNIIVHQCGESFDKPMRFVAEFEAPGDLIWTAPSVFVHQDRPLVIAGVNKDGPQPDQRLHFFYLDDPHTCVGYPPEPLRQFSYRNSNAWRDAQIMQLGPSYYWLYVSTGGFRWGGSPNIVVYESNDPLGKWRCLGPIVDPAVSQMYAEMERPQLHWVDGRWVLWWSTWETRHFANAGSAMQHVWMDPHDWGVPTIQTPVININGPYGLQAYDNDRCCGWVWTNVEKKEGTVALWKAPEMWPQIRQAMQRAVTQCRSNGQAELKSYAGA